MAIPWGDIFKIGAPIAGAVIGGISASNASKAQTKAIQAATQQTSQAGADAAAEIRRQYDTSRADLEPWRREGANALALLTKLQTPGAMAPGEVESYLRSLPGFTFQESELQKNIDRRNAATGNRLSGRGLKEMTRWMQDNLYGPAYRGWTNDLQTLAGYGQNGSQLTANLGANAASNAANIRTGTASGISNLGLEGGQVAGMNNLTQGVLLANALKGIQNNYAPESPIEAYYRSITPGKAA